MSNEDLYSYRIYGILCINSIRIDRTYCDHSNPSMHFGSSLWSNKPFPHHPISFLAADIFFECDIYPRRPTFGRALSPLLCNALWTTAIVIPCGILRQSNAIQAIDIDRGTVHGDRLQSLWLCFVSTKKKLWQINRENEKLLIETGTTM